VSNACLTISTSGGTFPANEEAQRGAAYAVHSALNLTISESLLLGCRPIIVEGSSDQHYLTAIKTLLIRSGKITPQRELVFPPSGGAKTARIIASILTGRDDALPTVLLDDDVAGRKIAQEMRTSLYADSQERVLNVASFVGFDHAEVEDLIPPQVIAKQIDRQFRVPEPEDEFETGLTEGAPIVQQIEVWAAKQDLKLPPGWKIQLAKAVKQQLLIHGLSLANPACQESWIKLFTTLDR
jgi:5S rRNA maturation endonuclease (ribonuclease M5)